MIVMIIFPFEMLFDFIPVLFVHIIRGKKTAGFIRSSGVSVKKEKNL